MVVQSAQVWYEKYSCETVLFHIISASSSAQWEFMLIKSFLGFFFFYSGGGDNKKIYDLLGDEKLTYSSQGNIVCLPGNIVKALK